MQMSIFTQRTCSFPGILRKNSNLCVETGGVGYFQNQFFGVLLDYLSIHMIKNIHMRYISPHINTRDFQSHQGAIGFVPTRLSTISATTTTVSIAIGQSFCNLTIRLDSFGMGMNDIPQQIGIQCITGCPIDLKQGITRLRTESRSSVLILRTGPNGSRQMGT